MRIKEIWLKDMFSYTKEQHLKLENRNFIIGENGFGKTALLNSLKILLKESELNEKNLNNNSINKIAKIKVDFDEFSVEKIFNFNDKTINLTIKFSDSEELKDFEAEEFLKNRFPLDILDFIFFDGEVEKDLIISKKSKLQNIFSHIFDLDILLNMQKDSLKASKNILESIDGEEFKVTKSLENDKEKIELKLNELNLESESKIDELKSVEREIKNIESRLRSENKKVEKLQIELKEKEENLKILLLEFKSTNLFQMPLILNEELFNKLSKNSKAILEIKDKSNFNSKFSNFLDELNVKNGEKAIEKFYKLFVNDNINIELNYTKESFKALLSDIKTLKIEIENIQESINKNNSSLLGDEFIKDLQKDLEKKKELKSSIENTLEELKVSIDKVNIELKEVNSKLRDEFVAKKDEFAKEKAYLELKKIAEVSEQVYLKDLKSKIKKFNFKFRENLNTFIQKYHHIREIYLNENFEIKIIDLHDKELELNFLSAGQKQLLSFLLIKTILDFKNFSDFIFIDTPFGRLSNENRDFILNSSYLKFENLILLVTSSEYDYIKTKDIEAKKFEIYKDDFGSNLKEVSNG